MNRARASGPGSSSGPGPNSGSGPGLNPEPVRAFIALPLPPDWTAALAATVAQLRSSIPAGVVRWANPDGIHLTLQFLGNTHATLIPDIIAALTRHLTGPIAGPAAVPAPPVLTLSGLGAFPSGDRPRVIWAGVSGDLHALAALRQSALHATAELGWPEDKRPFRPHLTIGRVRDHATPAQRRAVAHAIAARVSAGSPPPARPWTADSVRLYRSVLAPAGAVYTSLAEVKIG